MPLVENIDPVESGLLKDDGKQDALQYHRSPSKVLSDAVTAGISKIDISVPVTVADSQQTFQGWKVPTGTSVFGDGQSAVVTGKHQTAFRLDGNSIYLSNLVGRGNSDSTNTQTSEFISDRMAALVDGKVITNLVVDGADIDGYTTGIAASGVMHAIYNNIRARNTKYSPVGLNSAGGYLLVTGGAPNPAMHVNCSNLDHTLVAGADRHTLYLSAIGSSAGWAYWNINNVQSDYSANSVNNTAKSLNPDSFNVPFAMSPIHLRKGYGLNLNNYSVRGYSCSAIDYESQYGSIDYTNVSNLISLEAQSFANGDLRSQGALRVGYGQYPYTNKYHNFCNYTLKMVRGLDNAGVKMEAGSDNGVHINKEAYANYTNGHLIVESGSAYKVSASSFLNFDNFTDTLIDSTSGLPTLDITGASNNITIGGNILSNRVNTLTKERVYNISSDCEEITCRFPRQIRLLVASNSVTVSEDRWDMMKGLTPSIVGSTVRIPLNKHVSRIAKLTAMVDNQTNNSITAKRVTDADSNTLTLAFWDSNTHAAAPVVNVNNVVVINFFA